MKGRDLDTANWWLRYPDPCHSKDRETTTPYLLTNKWSVWHVGTLKDSMPSIRASFTVHLIKAYFNAQECSERI
ncbi:hypothetical protein Taro_012812 [Colocasia esculenta]|uniref:Uncharacterized protein n=1 Tax=Colocasia esculenta TaxID=4460 RepID=A0A843UDV9_COLES|nr:hypothetical protein [Colocasia esculenta]